MEVEELAKISENICDCLASGDYSGISNKYCYALSFDRSSNDALKEDFELALKECNSSLSKLGRVEVVVSSFKENNIGLVFLAECSFPASDRSGIYVEVVLNSKGTVYVEQISAYSTVKNA